jgi:WD40 repeat protein
LPIPARHDGVLGISADGSQVYVKPSPGPVLRLDVTTRTTVPVPSTESVSDVFSPGGRTYYVGDQVGELTRGGSALGTPLYDRSAEAACFSPDGRWLYIARYDGLITVDTATGQVVSETPLRTPLASPAHAEQVGGVAVTPDGRRLVLTGMVSDSTAIFDLGP